jgi:BON domain
MLHATRLAAHFAQVTAAVLAALLALTTGIGRLEAQVFNPRDLQQEVLVRAALANDPGLQPLNLVVRVNDRVATLSGPVPTRELARRALETAKRVAEVRDVQDKMMVQFEERRLALPLVAQTPPSLPPAIGKPAIDPPSTTTVLHHAPPQTVGVWVPVIPQPPQQRPIVGVALLPYTTTQPGATGAVSLAKELPATKPASPPDAGAIASAVQSLIQGQERFHRMRFEFKQGKVYLSGMVYRWSDLHELAQAITQLPGIEGVVLSDVKTEPPRH